MMKTLKKLPAPHSGNNNSNMNNIGGGGGNNKQLNTDDIYRSKLNIEINEAPTTQPHQATSGAANGAVVQANSNSNNNNDTNNGSEDSNAAPPLKSLSLRGNQLCGSILIGNYSHLTQLEVTENGMEVLDLSSLAQLQALHCTRNKLMELLLNGSNLLRITAAENCLHAISVLPLPTRLQHLDISNNNFTVLPAWIGACEQLETLTAHRNQLQTIAEFCAGFRAAAVAGTAPSWRLKRLNLAYNALRSLPKRWPEAFAGLEHLQLHSNALQQLPENFFSVMRRHLVALNLSCNKLATLPRWDGLTTTTTTATTTAAEVPRLEQLMLSANQLDERAFDVLQRFERLRVLHAAYNKIASLPPACVRSWPGLEQLVLAGNLLQHLPDNLATLRRLQVLRVHSNLLLTAPPHLAQLGSLRVLDLAHNHLDRVNLLGVVARGLKHLDLSCNRQLHVDAQQLRQCQSEKHWRLVDVTGRNRLCLPTSGGVATTAAASGGASTGEEGGGGGKAPWQIGFSETPGAQWPPRKLHVSQVRCCNFQADESCLVGMFDGGDGGDGGGDALPKNVGATLARLVPQIVRQERTVKDTRGAFLANTLLAVQQKLQQAGGAASSRQCGITLCHIARECQWGRNFVRPQKSKRYVLRVASVGRVAAYLVRKTTPNVCLTASGATAADAQPLQVGRAKSSKPPAPQPPGPHSATEAPALTELVLSNDDEYVVVCNRHAWSVLDADRVAREVRKEENVVLAAKRLQDIAQAFGADGGLSVIVLRLRHLGTDVDQMIKELKQIVRRKPPPPLPLLHHATTHHVMASPPPTPLAPLALHQPSRSDRSSPSGQSDRALSPLGKDGSGGVGDAAGGGGGDADSVLSEEQFKCWEYMLEQNTQLLFDKELNTISKSSFCHDGLVAGLANGDARPTDFKGATSGGGGDTRSALLRHANGKFLSSSSPHLLLHGDERMWPRQQQQHHHPHHPHQQQQKQQMSFLSRYLGSCRSFQAAAAAAAASSADGLAHNNGGGVVGGGARVFDVRHRRDSLALAGGGGCGTPAPGKGLLGGGGPNAAYFGSLQRLMPYNLEYDFALMQERSVLGEEDADADGDGEEGAEHAIDMDDDDDEEDEVDEDEVDEFMAHECRMRKYWGVATTEL